MNRPGAILGPGQTMWRIITACPLSESYQHAYMRLRGPFFDDFEGWKVVERCWLGSYSATRPTGELSSSSPWLLWQHCYIWHLWEAAMIPKVSRALLWKNIQRCTGISSTRLRWVRETILPKIKDFLWSHFIKWRPPSSPPFYEVPIYLFFR